MKTFRSKQEFSGHDDAAVSAMVEELETSERISKVNLICAHPNVVSVLKVPRGALIRVPRCGTEGKSFHGIVTEYADGGELCNYLVLPIDTEHETGLGGNCSFSEPQARFLFRQIINLLQGLHHPPAGEVAYFHGDLKDSNLVIDGSTLKLIDYASLSKVAIRIGAGTCWLAHRSSFRNGLQWFCVCVSLWAQWTGFVPLMPDLVHGLEVVQSCAARAQKGTG